MKGKVMDFDGKSFEDEEPVGKPPASKASKVIKRVFKIIFLSITAIVWIAIIASIIIRGNDRIVKTPILSDAARGIYSADTADFPVYEVHTREFMNGDATIQLITGVYAEKANELEIGLRVKNGSEVFKFCRIVDEDGNVYAETSRFRRTRNISLGSAFTVSYSYERISFGGLKFDLSRNIVNRDYTSTDISAEISKYNEDIEDVSAYLDASEAEEASNKHEYYLEIYNSETAEEPLFRCVIYDDDTLIQLIDYELPDEKYLS